MTASTFSRLCRIATLTALATGLALLIAGCGAIPSQLISPPSAGQSITGHVHGGQQSVSNSHIYLFAAATGGYGGPAVSLLNPTAPGVATDSNGSYVTSDSAGNFSLNGTYNCSPGQQVYILARGGNPGLPAGTNNPAIAMISSLGNCPNAGNLAATVPVVVINEVSTIASVYALAGFMTDPTHLSSSGTQLAQQGVANAFLSASNLYTVSNGSVGSNTIANNGVPPQATINTLANLLATCVNSTGTTPACTSLFANTKSLAGTLPTDTVTAALNIAHNPGVNVAALFNLAVPAPPFQPSLTSAPNDWTIAITFYADLMAGPYYPAIDALGNLWVPDYANNTITEFNPLGMPISGYNGFVGNSLNEPFSIAIDSAQSAWVANYAYSGSAVVSHFSLTGSPIGSYPCGTNCAAVAIDSLQNIWVASNSGVTTIHNSGIAISQFSLPATSPGLAIDSASHGWSIGNSHAINRLTMPSTVTPYAQTISSTATNDLNQFAIDSSDNVWFTSGKNNAIGRVDPKGNIVSPGTGYTGGGLTYPAQLAIDGSNRVWVVNRDANSVSAFNHDGSAITSATGYQPSGQLAPDPSIPIERIGIRDPHGLAIDGSGNVWVTNFTANSVTEIIGLATPVVTPISTSTHGQMP
jgi:sugar lactone lactonase YvrE